MKNIIHLILINLIMAIIIIAIVLAICGGITLLINFIIFLIGGKIMVKFSEIIILALALIFMTIFFIDNN